MEQNTHQGQHPDLDYIFHPRSVALVGVTSDSNRPANIMFLHALMKSGYQGKIYPINRNEDKIMGLQVYRSIMDVPGPVDYVVVIIPASSTPQLMSDCVAKGVKVVSFFTAGFSETGSEGKKLEADILRIAAEGQTRILGPNCMGIYCPRTGLTFNPPFAKISGPVGLFCQSGGNAMALGGSGPTRGVYFSKIISYGNASDLNEADFLNYFANDPETEIIAAYIEGIKDAPRFFKLLKATASRKPVIILKGGRTQAGTRAVSSHTGSLAGTEIIWDAISRQTGLIRVQNLEELLDMTVTFRFMKPPQGRSVGIIAMGGGLSVMATDICESSGLAVPPFPEEVKRELRKMMPEVGTSMNNPVDLPFDPIGMSGVVQTVSGFSGIDFVLISIDMRVAMAVPPLDLMIKQTEGVIDAGRKSGKPIAVVIHPDYRREWSEMGFKLEQPYIEAGLPVYPSVERAARSISRFMQYHESLKEGKWHTRL